MQIQNFDATGIEPKQSVTAHPPGTFPFIVTNTYGQETPAAAEVKTGCMLCVVFTSQQGSIINRYNIFNQNETAVKIAKEQLSALCHATGVFKLTIVDGNNQILPLDQWARELRNARGVMEIGPQKDKPDFMEVKKVYDAAGNEPGKGPAPAPQPNPQQQGGWQAPGNGQTAPAAAPNGSGGGWQQPGATQAAPQQQTPPAQGGWQPGPQGGAPTGSAPPWATPK